MLVARLKLLVQPLITGVEDLHLNDLKTDLLELEFAPPIAAEGANIKRDSIICLEISSQWRRRTRQGGIHRKKLLGFDGKRPSLIEQPEAVGIGLEIECLCWKNGW